MAWQEIPETGRVDSVIETASLKGAQAEPHRLHLRTRAGRMTASRFALPTGFSVIDSTLVIALPGGALAPIALGGGRDAHRVVDPRSGERPELTRAERG